MISLRSFLFFIALTFLAFPALAETVDINSASAKEIAAALKGVGKKQAEAIVDYRKKNGPFKSVKDLANVKGVGAKTIENNKANIKIAKAKPKKSANKQAAKKESKEKASEVAARSGPIDINKASAEEIAAALKGVGAKQSAAIVEYRQINGDFNSLEDLANVKGVGAKTLENNKDIIGFGKMPMKTSETRQRTAKAEPESTSTTRKKANEYNGMVNLNTASIEQLESLHNIGPVKAARIIEYRELNGPFKGVEELMNVSGIAEKTLEDNLGRLTVN